MKLLGHPVHPMLVGFPLGLLITGVGFDLAQRASGTASLATTAFYMLLVGVVIGTVTALFGLWDWLYIEKGTRARRIGAWHGLGNALALLLFAVSVYQRWGAPGFVASGSALSWALAGAALLLITGWLGGELVFTLGEGVDEQAHADAPSSLSQK